MTESITDPAKGTLGTKLIVALEDVFIKGCHAAYQQAILDGFQGGQPFPTHKEWEIANQEEEQAKAEFIALAEEVSALADVWYGCRRKAEYFDSILKVHYDWQNGILHDTQVYFADEIENVIDSYREAVKNETLRRN